MTRQQQSRPDSVSAQIVEAGLARQQTHGRASAAQFMAQRGIRDQVIARVLCEPPWHRRPERNG